MLKCNFVFEFTSVLIYEFLFLAVVSIFLGPEWKHLGYVVIVFKLLDNLKNYRVDNLPVSFACDFWKATTTVRLSPSVSAVFSSLSHFEFSCLALQNHGLLIRSFFKVNSIKVLPVCSHQVLSFSRPRLSGASILLSFRVPICNSLECAISVFYFGSLQHLRTFCWLNKSGSTHLRLS